ncbi:MAG: catalase HPII, partial [Sphingomicrobium sp.]
SDLAAINDVVNGIEKRGGRVFLIAPKVGGIAVKGGTLKADGQLAGSPSVLFDAVALVLAPAAAEKLCMESAAVGFVMDAYAHVKTIGFSEGATALLERAGIVPDDGVVDLKAFVKVAPKRHWDREPKVRTLA